MDFFVPAACIFQAGGVVEDRHDKFSIIIKKSHDTGYTFFEIIKGLR